ncbi:hypothetical protein MAP00_008718 [Monascus purpureus]|nr:hypothetical protein MAP00_008718 [Monascus purpureus]
MAPFKDEHILLIAPGSQVTLAQLGLPESFTPARFRFPTRMFPADKKGEYEPYKIRERGREVKVSNGDKAPQEDVEMKDVQTATQEGTTNTATGNEPEKPQESEETNAETTGDANGEANGEPKEETVEIFYEEDVMSDEGAVYPIQNGRVVDWPCFFALLMHIRNTLSPPLHTPVIIISQPVWSTRDREAITQFVFEKFKTPGFCLMDSALAACYGYGTATATVVDVGKDKADVTAVTDFMVNEHGRGIALEGCGGDAMTDKLVELLGPKGFTREMCEQLKRSNITEILPSGTPLPGLPEAPQASNPAASASTGTSAGKAPNTDVPRGPGDNTQTGPEGGNAEDDEGVLNVAAIVTGNTSEYLAKKDKEKAEKAASKKGDQTQKQARLPNSKKETASFQFEEFVQLEPEKESGNASKRFIRQKRDIAVGVERFLAATPKQQVGDRLSNGILEDIADQIHHTILAVPDATKRSELWDSLIVLGNGSKIKGRTSIFGLRLV